MATYASIKYDMDLSSNATGTGGMTLLSTQTASSDSTVTFDSSIDSTYKEYIFKYYDIHPSEGVMLAVNFRDGSTAYDATKTGTFFEVYQNEAGTSTSLAYVADYDIAQGTGVQRLGYVGNENDESLAGTLHLFDPSNTTFIKHYIATTPGYHGSNLALTSHVAGYCNVTAAIDGVQFSMTSGNIDSGTFKMYGVS
tara:strand:+ start:31 stop:618 length:588 start_codon:yes stop_codon:yes gene_type:complete